MKTKILNNPGLRIGTLALFLLLTGAWISSPVYAAFPGKNGRIAFVSNRPIMPGQLRANRNIYTMNPDGTDIQLVSPVPLKNYNNPVWSPDGKHIFFDARLGDINQVFMMNADGSSNTQITNCPTVLIGCGSPGVSPDGKKLAYFGPDKPDATGIYEAFISDIDGKNEVQLTFSSNDVQAVVDTKPRFTSDGKQLILTMQNLARTTIAVYVVDVDASNFRQYTDLSVEGWNGDVKPNDSRIVFMDCWFTCASNIFIGKAPKALNSQNYTAIARVDALQITTDAPDGSNNNLYAAYSPDGKKLVFQRSVQGRRTELYTVDLLGPKPYVLTPITNNNNGQWNDGNPDWQPVLH